MKMKLLFSVLVLSLSTISYADRMAGKTRGQLVQACKPDMEKFCKGIELGDGRLMKCLKEHKDELSPDCKAAGADARENFKEKREEMRDACKADFETHCKGIFGPRNRINCLKKNEDKLSATCKATLPHRE